MNLLDIILGLILIIAFVGGMKKGLFVTLASLIGLVLGIIGAIYFSEYAASYINEWTDWSERTSNVAAMIVTFIIIVFVVNWAGKLLTKIADFAFLGVFNKLLGGVFNMLFAAFIVSVIFMFFNEWNTTDYSIPEEKINSSYLYEPVAALAPMVLPNLIKEVENFEIPEEIINKVKEESEQKIKDKIDSILPK